MGEWILGIIRDYIGTTLWDYRDYVFFGIIGLLFGIIQGLL